MIQQAHDHRIDGDGFTRARGARHQQVRHACHIDHGRAAFDVFAQRHWQAGFATAERIVGQDFFEENLVADFVWHFDTDGGFAWNRRYDTHAQGFEG